MQIEPQAVNSPRVYLDHAATTPMMPEAIAALVAQLAQVGNPSSLHSSGRRARRIVEESREELAAAVGARPSDVIFTSGGTEANNLAVKGSFRARVAANSRRRRVIASRIEHHAVLDPVQHLAQSEGAEISWLGVDGVGRVDPQELRAQIALDPESVALVSVMWANNEVGTLQPIAELAEIAHEFNIPLHSDAVQAIGQVPLHFAQSGVDLMSFSAHKLGGPHGVGALLAVRGASLEPQVHGGGQERQVRSGTLDEPAIRSFATAASLAVQRQPQTQAWLLELRAQLVAGVQAAIPGLSVHGPAEATARLPGVANFGFAGCDGDSLLYLLDAQGIECSTGSACQAGVPQPSHVLQAMGVDHEAIRGALRFSLGHTSTREDVRAVLQALPAVVDRARGAVAAGVL